MARLESQWAFLFIMCFCIFCDVNIELDIIKNDGNAGTTEILENLQILVH